MQPPLEYFGLRLPDAGSTPGHYLAFVVKRHKYISVVIQHREGVEHGPHFGIVLHRVEMAKLVKALEAALQAPVDPELKLESYGGTEGVYLGRLPEPREIIDPSMGLKGPTPKP